MSQPIPTRTLAGVTVPDTPLITAAISFARKHLEEWAFNHVMRSWLFGCVIASKDPVLSPRDLELHSVAAILHDMGWVLDDSTITSPDRRFEVDGADCAREFVRRETTTTGANDGEWDKHRLQLLWDAIALHTTPSIGLFKEIEVTTTIHGTFADLLGPDNSYKGLLTWDEWKAIVAEYPRMDLKGHVTGILCELCQRKPESTYDNPVGDFGEKHVDGYSRAGKRPIDWLEAMNLDG